jgi:hypothetical protein
LKEDSALNRGAESVLECHARISGVSSLKGEKQGTIRPNLAEEPVSGRPACFMKTSPEVQHELELC